MRMYALALPMIILSLSSFAQVELNCQSSDGKVVLKTDWIRKDGEMILKLTRTGEDARYFSAHPITLQNNIVFIPKVGDNTGNEFRVSLGRMNSDNRYPKSKISATIGAHLGRDDRMTKPESFKYDLSCTISGEMNLANVCTEDDDDAYGQLLMKATAEGDFDKVQQAIACGADTNVVNEQGCTSLMISTVIDGGDCGLSGPDRSQVDTYRWERSKAIFKYLLDDGANTDKQDLLGESVAHKLSSSNSFPELIATLKESGANLNLQDRYGMTAVMQAALSGNVNAIMAFVKADVDLTKKNVLGQTAYDLGSNLKPSVRSLLSPSESMGLVILGAANGCSPSSIKIPMGTPTKITLKSTTSDMFVMTAPDLEINLMAAPNGTVSQIVNTNKMGTFKFQCGVHGGSQMTGEIVVTM